MLSLSELFLGNKNGPAFPVNFFDDNKTVLFPEMICLRIILSYGQPDRCFADLLQIRANILNDRTSDLLSLKSGIHHKESYISDCRFRISINEIQNRIRLFHFCCPDRTQCSLLAHAVVDPFYEVVTAVTCSFVSAKYEGGL